MRKIGNKPIQQSTRDALCERGRKIGYNTACPDILFMALDGTAWSIDRSGVCVNHGSVAELVAKVETGGYRITLTSPLTSQLAARSIVLTPNHSEVIG